VRITESRQKAQISNQIPTSKTNIRRSKGKKTHPTFVRCVFCGLLPVVPMPKLWLKTMVIPL